MHLQPPVVQEHFFFRQIFVYLFFRPRFFVHAFAILTVFVPHFFVCVVFPLQEFANRDEPRPDGPSYTPI